MNNIHALEIHSQGTIADTYITSYGEVSSLYAYPPYEQNSYAARLRDLQAVDNALDRDVLTTALSAYNERVNPHEAVRDNIALLKRKDSVVVIGGQQAGVLTGPLYTIHKAISILQLAREQKEKLGVPVVPVFWIAGEDHDLAEVNHLWIPSGAGQPRKLALGRDDGRKLSIGRRPLAEDDVATFMRHVADAHPDTTYKGKWTAHVQQLAVGAETWSDWFARIFHALFAREGLVLIDLAAAEFNGVAAPLYTQIIAQNEALDEAVGAGTNRLTSHGYEPLVDVFPGQAHLFIEREGERSLLLREGDTFVTKDGQASYSPSELIDIAHSGEPRLSSNVVTRPLVQEYLFPVLAAVLGPGEIAYWGQYSAAFSLFNWRMPILYPRLGFTLVERDVAKYIEDFHLSPEEAVFRMADKRTNWLRAQDALDLDSVFGAFKRELATLHEHKLQQLAPLFGDATHIVEKNRTRMLREVDYLERQAHRLFRRKHDVPLKQLKRIEASLTPQGFLQERVHNVFSYVNQYGWQWLHSLVNEPLDLTQQHYMVHL